MPIGSSRARRAGAANFGIPPLLVGLTIVGFATSAPEMLVAAVAAFNGNPAIAVGNALGSNIANIGLVIGVTALVLPLPVRSEILKREFPIMFVCIALALLLCLDAYLDKRDGVILFSGLVVLLGTITWLSFGSDEGDALGEEMAHHLAGGMSTVRAIVWFTFGLTLLLLGSHMLVDGAVAIATHYGVSDLVIGLTIVAIGTSLPELAASIASALKGESDIALGNVIGSNMFNVLGVMGVPAVIEASTLDAAVLSRDFPVMIGLSVALFLIAVARISNHARITRIEGALLLAGFAAYQWLLYASS